MKSVLLALTSALALGSGAALAQGVSLGEMEYMNSCAACHGASGAGDGPIVPYLVTQTLPDLTALAANNGGVFPVSAAFTIIDGSASVGAHGSSDMPVWGDRYRARAMDDPEMTGFDIDAYANLRIVALIEYLVSLQAE